MDIKNIFVKIMLLLHLRLKSNLIGSANFGNHQWYFWTYYNIKFIFNHRNYAI